ncbi:MAG TPA: hypothetical protein VGG97_01750 [Bryobacteraceae bacterium]|jgi:hypothetical protein
MNHQLATAATRNFVSNQPLKLRPILDGAFRANPNYELVLFGRLPVEQRELFEALTRDPNFYGILRPKEGVQLALKSACRDTAALFHALQETSKLPSFVVSDTSPESTVETNQAIAELVLDGVLQMDCNGQMLHGPLAFADICESFEKSDPKNEIAHLSRQALLYAQSLPTDDANLLATRLYSYGRIAISPSWRKKFPGEESVRQCLGIDAGGLKGWQALPPDPNNNGWIAWQSRRPSPPPGGRVAGYKLYVSPHPNSLREAFEALVSAAEAAHADAFKVGRDLPGVLRPDKMVAYFRQFEQVEEAAGRIVAKLPGCPAQGVPFTTQLGSPLVSWGSDPATEDDVPVWLSRQSWRLWVTNRLAVALLAGKRSGQTEIQPWQFATERLRLEGVDTDTWTPLKKEQN